MATKKQGVIIESRKTGETYAVSEATFKKHYEEQGFHIVSMEDGTEFKQPKPKAPAKAKKAAAPSPAALTDTAKANE